VPETRWQSSWQDTTTGLYYVQARWYSPALGRFLSVDPLYGNQSDPGSLNRYAYVSGNPMGGVDPLGTCTWDTISGTCVGANADTTDRDNREAANAERQRRAQEDLQERQTQLRIDEAVQGKGSLIGLTNNVCINTDFNAPGCTAVASTNCATRGTYMSCTSSTGGTDAYQQAQGLMNAISRDLVAAQQAAEDAEQRVMACAYSDNHAGGCDGEYREAANKILDEASSAYLAAKTEAEAAQAAEEARCRADFLCSAGQFVSKNLGPIIMIGAAILVGAACVASGPATAGVVTAICAGFIGGVLFGGTMAAASYANSCVSGLRQDCSAGGFIFETATQASMGGLFGAATGGAGWGIGAVASKVGSSIAGASAGSVSKISNGKLPTDLGPSLRALAGQNITNSGTAVIGRFPGYVAKAQAIKPKPGASYFSLGSAWDDAAKPLGLNQLFLDGRIAAGDRILVSLAKSEIKGGGVLPWEIQYLKENGYRWVNQWALKLGS
jgi:RHS repeat-associated protein